MAVDPYSPCPCGSGKKVKFCCADLAPEMEKIERMLDGQQRVACLEHLEAVEKKYPDRAYLLGVRANVQMQLDRLEDAEQTLVRYREAFPDNAVAWATTALLRIVENRIPEAVDALQDAIERCVEMMPPQVFDLLGAVGEALLRNGHLIAARAHLTAQALVGGEDDTEAAQLLVQLNRSGRMPLPLKDTWQVRPAPEGVDWAEVFNAARLAAVRIQWRRARKQFDELAVQVGEHPTIVWNRAVLSMYLADETQAVELLRKYATFDIPRMDAVEAETLAMWIDDQGEVDTIDVVKVEYDLSDEQEAWTRLTTHSQARQLNVDLSPLAEEDGPPPRALFVLLDGPMPEVSEGEVEFPLLLAQACLYGKQTDRPARLVLTARRNETFELAKQTAVSICGDTLTGDPNENAESPIAQLDDLLSPRHWYGSELPRERAQALMQQERRQALLGKWPDLPTARLDGQTPRQAAADPLLQTRVMALVEYLGGLLGEESPIEPNELRGELGLPLAEPIDPTGLDIDRLPLVRLAKLDVGKLNDEQIQAAYQRAEMVQDAPALLALGRETLQREQLREQFDLMPVYSQLARIAPEQSEALSYLEEGRKLAAEAGHPGAVWDLEELTLRLRWGQLDRAVQMAGSIQRQYGRDPHVMRALMSILVGAGLIHPDGSPRVAPRQAAAEAAVEPAQEPGRLWTPESAVETGGEKKLIWTPD